MRWVDPCLIATVFIIGCASPPDTDQCLDIRRIDCDGGYLDDSGAWVSAPWRGPFTPYPALTTVEFCHGLGRPPTSVELWASFEPTGNLAQQIGNVATVVPYCGTRKGVTDHSVLLRNGGGQDFYVRVVFR